MNRRFVVIILPVLLLLLTAALPALAADPPVEASVPVEAPALAAPTTVAETLPSEPDTVGTEVAEPATPEANPAKEEGEADKYLFFHTASPSLIEGKTGLW